MKKAIVLTYADISKEEKELLKNTDIFKIACNDYCAELKPNIRLTADNNVNKCLECDSCKVISCNYDLNKDRVINACRLPKRHSSLISCIDYLLLKGFTHILLVATNPVGKATYNLNIEGLSSLKPYLYLYKYTKDGNFDIPHKTVKEFIMDDILTDKDRILGVKEPEKRILNKTLLTDSCLYEVSTEGKSNVSVESGELLATILPLDLKEMLMKGENEIVYNGIRIKRITDFELQEPVKEEAEPIEEQEEAEPKKTVKKAVNKKKVKK